LQLVAASSDIKTSTLFTFLNKNEGLLIKREEDRVGAEVIVGLSFEAGRRWLVIDGRWPQANNDTPQLGSDDPL
jgi:hypothetical protein